ncbi:MAG: serine/threonine-protein kinase [Ktedonobacteraceae bacterium]
MKLWRYGHPIEHLGQRYRLDGMLGSGGMAEVCLAWDERDQREVALKILKSDDLDQDTLNRFMKEAGQIVDWQHPHILRIYEQMQIELIDVTQGSVLFYIAMEYARGGDLQKRLTPGKPFPLSAGFALFRQLCDAVEYAHTHGVIHRDLKPLNILFRRPTTGPEEVVLSDFGLAVQADASHHTFARGGTLAYMAPEQLQGHAQPASDLFALGVILYQLCTGRLPFRRTLLDLARAGDLLTPTRPSLLNVDLPPGLDEPILRALQELPIERYHSAREFWDTVHLALLSNARTFPVLADELWSQTGTTWPFNGSEQSFVLGPVSAVSESMQEGPESSPGSLREKQKAFPERSFGLSLPSYSVPRPPNPARHFASEPAAPQPLRPAENPVQAPMNLPLHYLHGEPELASDLQPSGLQSGSTLDLESLGSTLDVESTLDPGQPNTRRRNDPQTARSQRGGDSEAASSSFTQARFVSGDSSQHRTRSPEHTQRSLGNNQTEHTQSRSSRQPDNTFTRPPTSSRPPSPSDAGARSTRDLAASSQARPPHSTFAASNTSVRRQLALPLLKVPHGRGSRARKWPLVPVVTTLALLALIGAILLAAGAQGSLLHLFGAPTVTVTLTPQAHTAQDNYALTAIPGAPTDSVQHQVAARLITATSPNQSVTANASGSTPGQRATGQLTFINNTANTITIQSITITGNSGVQISFTGPISVPANPPTITVPGFAVNPGIAGNIPTLDISKACCVPNGDIFVKNTAFTGGQDAQANSMIQQKDIDGAAGGLASQLTQGAQIALGKQVGSGERVVDGTLLCQSKVSANQRAGDLAKSVTVQVVETCREEVYDDAAARQVAGSLLNASVTGNPNLGAAYHQVGQPVVTMLSVSVTGNAGNVALSVQVRGVWAYAFSAARLHQLAMLVAGKSQSEARALLLQQVGIMDAQFRSTGNLPGNVDEIEMRVLVNTSP